MDLFTAFCLFGIFVGIGVSFYPAWLKYLEFRKLRAEDEVSKSKKERCSENEQ